MADHQQALQNLERSQMLRDRNLTSHTYNALVADEILGRLLDRYLPRFRATQARLRQAMSSAGSAPGLS